ncbi:MAG: IS66 family insertion sequence element accessory protein TnpB [Tannerella sp.]|nr:IS66 family insertion sequence element accessory protein TnpB [Tannerella sp.]
MRFGGKPVYLCCGHTDMRKSINGLSAIVSSSFSLDPFSETLFVFCNKNRDRIKILEWDGDGFWLYFKRLERGRFRWPASDPDSKVMGLSAEELSTLIAGARLEKKLKRNEVLERRTA